MILADLHDGARAADLDDFLDRLTAARDAARERYTCQVCGGPDPSGQWECGDCWATADEDFERRADR